MSEEAPTPEAAKEPAKEPAKETTPAPPAQPEANPELMKGMMEMVMKNPRLAQDLPNLIERAINKISALEQMARDQGLIKRGLDVIYQQNQKIITILEALEVEEDESPIEGEAGPEEKEE